MAKKPKQVMIDGLGVFKEKEKEEETVASPPAQEEELPKPPQASKHTLLFTRTRPVRVPVRGTGMSAGIDLFVPDDYPETILEPHQRAKIPSGLKFFVPESHALVAMNKSGKGHMSVNAGLDKTAELIDEDYEGEVHICVVNNGRQQQTIKPGMKLIQLVLVPVVYAKPKEVENEQLEAKYRSRAGERGEGGFGSTGS